MTTQTLEARLVFRNGTSGGKWEGTATDDATTSTALQNANSKDLGQIMAGKVLTHAVGLGATVMHVGIITRDGKIVCAFPTGTMGRIGRVPKLPRPVTIAPTDIIGGRSVA